MSYQHVHCAVHMIARMSDCELCTADLCIMLYTQQQHRGLSYYHVDETAGTEIEVTAQQQVLAM